MPVPATPEVWASEAGGSVVAGLTATNAEFLSTSIVGSVTYGLIKYTLTAANLSAVLPGHTFVTAGFVNAANNGSFYITAADDTLNTITIRQTTRLDAVLNETGQTASSSVTSGGALLSAPSTAKQQQGYLAAERPSANHFNWLFNILTDWIVYFANGGAITLRATLAAWKAVTRTGAGGEIINEGGGFVRFDETATDESGEGFYAQTTGAGVGVVELASPDMIWSLLANEINETLTPASAYLDFGSISATSTGTATVTVYGARSEDLANVGLPSALSASVIPWARVTADDTVTIYLYNPTGAPIDPSAGDFNVFVTKPNRNPANTLRGLKIKTNLLSGAYASGTALDTDLALDNNTAAFWLLLANAQHKEDLLNDAGAYAILQASTDADAIMAAMNGGSY